jgi:putative spermidine/putrescine transport system permease protein
LAQPTCGPSMYLLSSSKVYEPSALAIVSFALTWGSTAIFQWLSRDAGGPRVR